MSYTKATFALTFATCLIIGYTGPAVSQNASDGAMTAEEITNAFEKQKTRGLVLVPSDSSTSSTDTSASSTQATSVTTAAATDQSTYTEVAKSDQVNIKIKFDFDSATLRDDQKPQLDTLCQVMKAVDVKLFQIVGHTDSSGSASYNQNLSLLRAKEVKRHLVNECGIAENRLEAIGMGEAAPFNSADPRSDDNRRVEFQALG